MDTSEITKSRKSRIHLPRAYAFSLLLHVAVAGAAILLKIKQPKPVINNGDMIFTIESGADMAGWPAESVLSEPEPQPLPATLAPVDSQIAVAPAMTPAVTPGEVGGGPEGNLLLLSGLPKIDIPDEGAGDAAGKEQLGRKNWLEDVSMKKPMFMVSSSTEPAVDPMDAYFTVFVQSIRDAYEKPEDVVRQQQRQLSVRIQYEIMADGTIGTVSIVRSSGSVAYDQSVVKAFRSIARIGPRPDLRGSVNVADFCLVN